LAVVVKLLFTLFLLSFSLLSQASDTCATAVESIVKTYASGTSQFLSDFPFGQKLKSRSRSYKKYKGAYQLQSDVPGTDLKKGDIFYLDKGEKDHIEVFTKKGKSRNVMDLEGKVHVTKTKAAIGRTIDVK
jgi:hypothetical protein